MTDFQDFGLYLHTQNSQTVHYGYHLRFIENVESEWKRGEWGELKLERAAKSITIHEELGVASFNTLMRRLH